MNNLIKSNHENDVDLGKYESTEEPLVGQYNKKALENFHNMKLQVGKNHWLSVKDLFHKIYIASGKYCIIMGGKAVKIVYASEKTSFVNNKEDIDFMLYDVDTDTITKIQSTVQSFLENHFKINSEESFPVKTKFIRDDNLDYSQLKIKPIDSKYANNSIDINIYPKKPDYYYLHHSWKNSFMISGTVVIFPALYDDNGKKLSLKDFKKIAKSEFTGCNLEKIKKLNNATPGFLKFHIYGHIDNVEVLTYLTSHIECNKIKKNLKHFDKESKLFYLFYVFCCIYGKENKSFSKLCWKALFPIITQTKEENFSGEWKGSPFFDWFSSLTDNIKSFEKIYASLMVPIFSSGYRLDKPIQFRLFKYRILIRQPSGESDIPPKNSCFHLVFTPEQIKNYISHLSLDDITEIINIVKTEKDPIIYKTEEKEITVKNEKYENTSLESWIKIFQSLSCSDKDSLEIASKLLSLIYLYDPENKELPSFTTQFCHLILDQIFENPKQLIFNIVPIYLSDEQLLSSLVHLLVKEKDETKISAIFVSLQHQMPTLFMHILQSLEKEKLLEWGLCLIPIILTQLRLQKKVDDGLIHLLLTFISSNENGWCFIEHFSQENLYSLFKPVISVLNVLIENKESSEKIDGMIGFYLKNVGIHYGLQHLLQLPFPIFQKLEISLDYLANSIATAKTIPFLFDISKGIIKNNDLEQWKKWLKVWTKTSKCLDLKDKDRESLIKTLNINFHALCIGHNTHKNYEALITLFIPLFLESGIYSKKLEELLNNPYINLEQKLFWALKFLEEKRSLALWPIFKKVSEMLLENNIENEIINRILNSWCKIIETSFVSQEILEESENLFVKIANLFLKNDLENSETLFSWVITYKTELKKNKMVAINSQNESVSIICQLYDKYLKFMPLTFSSLANHNTFLVTLKNKKNQKTILKTQIILFTRWISQKNISQEELIQSNKLKNEADSKCSSLNLKFVVRFIETSLDKYATPLLAVISPDTLSDEEKQIYYSKMVELFFNAIAKKDKELIKAVSSCMDIQFLKQNKNFVKKLIEVIKNQTWNISEIPIPLNASLFKEEECEELTEFFFSLSQVAGTNWLKENKLTTIRSSMSYFKKNTLSKTLYNYLIDIIPKIENPNSEEVSLYLKLFLEKIEVSFENWSVFFEIISRFPSNILQENKEKVESLLFLFSKESQNVNLINHHKLLTAMCVCFTSLASIYESKMVFKILNEQIPQYIQKMPPKLLFEIFSLLIPPFLFPYIDELISHATKENKYLEIASRLISEKNRLLLEEDEDKRVKQLHCLLTKEVDMYGQMRSESLTNYMKENIRERLFELFIIDWKIEQFKLSKNFGEMIKLLQEKILRDKTIYSEYKKNKFEKICDIIFANHDVEGYKELLFCCVEDFKKGNNEKLLYFFEKHEVLKFYEKNIDTFFDICYDILIKSKFNLPKKINESLVLFATKTSVLHDVSANYVLCNFYHLHPDTLYKDVLNKILHTYCYLSAFYDVKRKEDIFSLIEKLLIDDVIPSIFTHFINFIIHNLNSRSEDLNKSIPKDSPEKYKKTTILYSSNLLLQAIKFLESSPTNLISFFIKVGTHTNEIFFTKYDSIISLYSILIAFMPAIRKNEKVNVKTYHFVIHEISKIVSEKMVWILSLKYYSPNIIISSIDLINYLEQNIRFGEYPSFYKELLFAINKKLVDCNIYPSFLSAFKLTKRFYANNMMSKKDYFDNIFNLVNGIANVNDNNHVEDSVTLLLNLLVSLGEIVAEDNKLRVNFVKKVFTILMRINYTINTLGKPGFNGEKYKNLMAKKLSNQDIIPNLKYDQISINITNHEELYIIMQDKDETHLFSDLKKTLRKKVIEFMEDWFSKIIDFEDKEKYTRHLYSITDPGNLLLEKYKNSFEHNIYKIIMNEKIFQKIYEIKLHLEDSIDLEVYIANNKEFGLLFDHDENINHMQIAKTELINFNMTKLTHEEKIILLKYFADFIYTLFFSNFDGINKLKLIYSNLIKIEGIEISEKKGLRLEIEKFLGNILPAHEAIAIELFQCVENEYTCITIEHSIEREIELSHFYSNIISRFFDNPENYNLLNNLNYRFFSFTLDLLYDYFYQQKLTEQSRFLFIEELLDELNHKQFATNSPFYSTWIVTKHYVNFYLHAFPISEKVKKINLKILDALAQWSRVHYKTTPDFFNVEMIGEKMEILSILLQHSTFKQGLILNEDVETIIKRIQETCTQVYEFYFNYTDRTFLYGKVLVSLCNLLSERNLRLQIIELLDTEILEFLITNNVWQKEIDPDKAIKKYFSILENMKNQRGAEASVTKLFQLLICAIYPIERASKIEEEKKSEIEMKKISEIEKNKVNERILFFESIARFALNYLQSGYHAYSMMSILNKILPHLYHSEFFLQFVTEFSEFHSILLIPQPFCDLIKILDKYKKSVEPIAYFNVITNLSYTIENEVELFDTFINYIESTYYKFIDNNTLLEEFFSHTTQILIRFIEKKQNKILLDQSLENQITCAHILYYWDIYTLKEKDSNITDPIYTKQNGEYFIKNTKNFIQEKYFLWLKKHDSVEKIQDCADYLTNYLKVISDDKNEILNSKLSPINIDFFTAIRCFRQAETFLKLIFDIPEANDPFTLTTYFKIKEFSYRESLEKLFKLVNVAEMTHIEKKIILQNFYSFFFRFFNEFKKILILKNVMLEKTSLIAEDNNVSFGEEFLEFVEKSNKYNRNVAKSLFLNFQNNWLTPTELGELYAKIFSITLDNLISDGDYCSFSFAIFLLKTLISRNDKEAYDIFFKLTIKSLIAKQSSIFKHYLDFISLVSDIYASTINFQNTKHYSLSKKSADNTEIVYLSKIEKRIPHILISVFSYCFESYWKQSDYDQACKIIRERYAQFKGYGFIKDEDQFKKNFEMILDKKKN